jgi:acetoin:2,6-dichlorophenolindophenol oxidoreductase subunit alpha
MYAAFLKSQETRMQLSRTQISEAYLRMKRIREFEERIVVEFANGEIPGFLHVYVGQEASGVGVCLELDDADNMASTHRGHGHCIAKGADLNAMMAEIYGKRDGLCRGKGGSMHIADLSKGMLGANAIVGGAPSLAIGAALSAKTLRTGRVAVAFTGDGGSNQGTVFEAMNMAVVLRLPAIFIIENNGFGEGTGASYACGTTDLAARAGAFGMPAVSVDGSDFFAVHDAMALAVERARAGEGPSTIETRCRRFYGHFVGDPQVYRDKEEIEALRRHGDPLQRFRKQVTDAALLDAADFDGFDAQVAVEIDAAVAFARAAPIPDAADLLADVYVSYR